MADSPSLESIEQKLKEALEELEALRRNDGLANKGKARRDIQSMDISLISVSKAQAAVPPRVVVTRQLRPAVSEIQAVQNALAKTRHIRILSSSRPRPQRVQWTSMELVNALGVEPALPRQSPALTSSAATEHGTGPLLQSTACLLYTSPSPRDVEESRMPSSA